LTIVAAWMRADTGVGPSIASGSQTWRGNWALLPIAPAKTSSATTISGIVSDWFGWIIQSIEARMSRVAPSGRFEVLTKMAMIPSAKPTSPTRLTMKAFLAARAADRLRYQKPMSR
jgi:hypothetical protein